MPPALLASQLDALELPTGEPDVLTVNVERPLPEVLDRIIAALDPDV
jgi:gluconate kinase